MLTCLELSSKNGLKKTEAAIYVDFFLGALTRIERIVSSGPLHWWSERVFGQKGPWNFGCRKKPAVSGWEGREEGGSQWSHDWEGHLHLSRRQSHRRGLQKGRDRNYSTHSKGTILGAVRLQAVHLRREWWRPGCGWKQWINVEDGQGMWWRGWIPRKARTGCEETAVCWDITTLACMLTLTLTACADEGRRLHGSPLCPHARRTKHLSPSIAFLAGDKAEFNSLKYAVLPLSESLFFFFFGITGGEDQNSTIKTTNGPSVVKPWNMKAYFSLVQGEEKCWGNSQGSVWDTVMQHSF